MRLHSCGGGCDYMKESFFWVFIISVEQDSAVLGEAQTCLKWWLRLFSLMARTQKEVLQAGFCSKSMHKHATDETVSCNRNKANVSTEDIFLFLWANAADTVAALSDHRMFDTSYTAISRINCPYPILKVQVTSMAKGIYNHCIESLNSHISRLLILLKINFHSKTNKNGIIASCSRPLW